MRGGIAGLLQRIWEVRAVQSCPIVILSAAKDLNRSAFQDAASYAADSERKTRWKRGPVNWTPTSFSPCARESATWTTRPWVAKSASLFLAPGERSTRREA